MLRFLAKTALLRYGPRLARGAMNALSKRNAPKRTAPNAPARPRDTPARPVDPINR